MIVKRGPSGPLFYVINIIVKLNFTIHSKIFGTYMKYLPFLFFFQYYAADDNAPANRTKDRQVDIEHIKINVSVDLKAKSVFGHVTHTLSPLRSNLSSFILHGDDMVIRRIRMGGKDLKYTHSGNEIHIDLPNPIGWDETVNVRIDYIANPREGTFFLT